MVGVAGFEPTTSATRTLRATNCATLRIHMFSAAQNWQSQIFRLAARSCFALAYAIKFLSNLTQAISYRFIAQHEAVVKRQ